MDEQRSKVRVEKLEELLNETKASKKKEQDDLYRTIRTVVIISFTTATIPPTATITQAEAASLEATQALKALKKDHAELESDKEKARTRSHTHTQKRTHLKEMRHTIHTHLQIHTPTLSHTLTSHIHVKLEIKHRIVKSDLEVTITLDQYQLSSRSIPLIPSSWKWKTIASDAETPVRRSYIRL